MTPIKRLLATVIVLTTAVGSVAGGTPSLSDAEFDALYKQLHLKNQPWATVPWKVSVTEARRLAASSKKPLFLVVNTGNCLGFV